MSRAWIAACAALLLIGDLAAGTLMYKNREGEVKTASDVTILSIDNRRVTIKINSGTEVIDLGRIVKYYNTNIKGGDFEDDSVDYDVWLGEPSCPRTGYSGSKKNRAVGEFTIPYNVNPKAGEKGSNRMRQPYFYLFVLTSSGDDGNRGLYSFSYPERARVSQKNYDEAKMMEKALDLDRPIIYPDDRNRLGAPVKREARTIGGGRSATFKLNGIGSRTIIAWRLVVWGKNGIVTTKDSVTDASYNVGKNWWLR